MKYRKKSVIVEAYQTDKEIIIHTLAGDMRASVGDYIITGIDGEQHTCKPWIFDKTYELVTEEERRNVMDKQEIKQMMESQDEIYNLGYVNGYEKALKDKETINNILWYLKHADYSMTREELIEQIELIAKGEEKNEN